MFYASGTGVTYPCDHHVLGVGKAHPFLNNIISIKVLFIKYTLSCIYATLSPNNHLSHWVLSLTDYRYNNNIDR